MRFPKFTGWVTVSLAIIWPDRRRRDPANLWKCIGDGLQKAGAIEDDCRMIPRILTVKRTADFPCCGITIDERAILFDLDEDILLALPGSVARGGGIYIMVEPADLRRVPRE